MRIILAFTLVICLCAASALCGASKDLGNGFLDHGVATPNSNHRGTVATVDGQGRAIVLSWLMDHRGGYELLLIDVEAGRAQEFPVKFCTGDTPRPAAHLLGIVIASAILLGGRRDFTLPDRQTLPSTWNSYSALRPVVADETFASAMAVFGSAKAAESQKQELCIDLYYQAAILAWQQLAFGDQAAVQTYQESLAHMFAAASR